MGIVWCDGKFLPEEDFRVSPKDRGLCQGLSLFETLLAVNGKPCLLREHLERMRSGMERLGMTSMILDADGFAVAITTLLEKNGLGNGMARIRLSLSLGDGGLDRIDNGTAWAWMTVAPVAETPDSVRITTAPWRRDKHSILRGIKTGNYAEHLIALDLARAEGFGEMLFYNTDGELCESAMANVFLITKGELLTPNLDSGCLAGVTRALLIRISKIHGIPCRELTLNQADVEKSEGIFLTSSIRGPVRVSSFRNRTFGEHSLFHTVRSIWLGEMARGGE